MRANYTLTVGLFKDSDYQQGIEVTEGASQWLATTETQVSSRAGLRHR